METNPMQPTLTNFSVLMMEDGTADVIKFQERIVGCDKTLFSQLAVGVCHTIEEAKASLQTGAFDLILLDINLPDSEDLQSVRALLKEFPCVPIVVHSGIPSAKLAAEAIALGAQDYIVKGTMGQDDLVRSLIHAKIRHDALRRLYWLSGVILNERRRIREGTNSNIRPVAQSYPSGFSNPAQ